KDRAMAAVDGLRRRSRAVDELVREGLELAAKLREENERLAREVQAATEAAHNAVGEAGGVASDTEQLEQAWRDGFQRARSGLEMARAELARAQAALDVAERSLSQAQSELHSAQNSLHHC